MIYDTLFWSPSGQYDDMTGLLVESYDVSEDGCTWFLNLYEGINFHNGNPLNAESTIRSLQYSDERGGQSAIFEPMESYTATGEYQITMVYMEPNPEFMYQFCTGHLGIWDSEASWELGDVTEAFDMVGSGPYYISDFGSGDFVEFTADADHWNSERQAHIETVTCKVITNTNTAYSAMAAGELDAMLCQDYEVKEMLEAIDTVNVITDEAPDAASPVWLNSSGQLCSYLTNIRVREAITMMVDAEELALAKSGSYGYVSSNIIASNIDYQQDCVYDPEGALAIFNVVGDTTYQYAYYFWQLWDFYVLDV